ncbi:MAG: glycosyltransferase [Gammaproteobacteria bacterium]
MRTSTATVRAEDITIIVPTRNEMRNIPAFLGSIPPDIGLIVVDASSDDTPRCIGEMRPNNTVLLRYPGTIAEARNAGTAAARTPWLVFTDADVTFAPRFFDRLMQHPLSDAVYGPKLAIGDYESYYAWFARGQRLSDSLGIPAASGSNLCCRRDVLQAVGGFDPALVVNEDSEVMWRIKRGGFRATFDSALAVFASDHRRLKQGALRKTVHSITRCFLLYFGLLPRRWRSSDWGYWKHSKNDGRL